MMEEIMLKTMMTSLQGMIPEVEPKNAIAEFMADEVLKITKGDENLEILNRLFINFANNEPEKCKNILIELHNDFGVWYKKQLEEED